MNQYGALARQHWKRWRPASYAAITDPAAYFTDLGEEAAGEITRLWAQMRAQAGNPPGEDYLARVARLNALRKQAEEVVLAQHFTARHVCRAPCRRMPASGPHPDVAAKIAGIEVWLAEVTAISPLALLAVTDAQAAPDRRRMEEASCQVPRRARVPSTAGARLGRPKAAHCQVHSVT